jgi:hypothetical protein
MDARNQKIIAHLYINKESFNASHPWFLKLKEQGLNPAYITTDGERSVIRAMRLVWPLARLQRCLYHIQHEGMRWLRTYPKTHAGRDLRFLLSKLSSIKNLSERSLFHKTYKSWLRKYKGFVLTLPRNMIACKDLQRTMVLINNALPDMFYCLNDSLVHSTTNALEGFHSRLKTDYQRHRGLTKEHRISYIAWYCYLKNNNNY